MEELQVETAPHPISRLTGAEPLDIDEQFLPAYRRFAPEYPLRQAIVFPAGDTGNRMALRRKSAALLCELDTGAVWALRIPRYAAATDESLLCLASALRAETLSRPEWKSIESRIHYELEYPVEILDPSFRADDVETWQVRSTAIDFCIEGLGTGDGRGEFSARAVADREQAATEALERFLARFVSGLDTEVFDLASSGAGCTAIRYNYLLGSDSATRRNRLQFHATLPLLVPIACGELMDPPRYTGRLRRAIDEGLPIVREICSWFQLPPNVVRTLIARDIAHTSEFWSTRVFALLRVLAAIPPEKRPGDGESWVRFTEACRLLSHLLKRPINTPAGLCSIAALSRNGYRGVAKHVGKEFLNDEQIAAVDQCFATLNLCLMWEASRKQQHAKPLAGAMPLMDKLIAELSLPRLRDVALRWRSANLAAQNRYAEEMATAKSRGYWLPLAAEPIAIGTLRFRELTTAAELEAEGRRMSHCVGSYARTCEAGRRHIFSCTAADGSPLSTLDILIAPDPSGAVVPSIMQHRGPHDALVPQQCGVAAKGLVALLREEPHRSRMTELHELSARPGELPRFQRMTVPQIRCAVEAFRAVLSGKMAYDRLVDEALAFYAAKPNGAVSEG